MALIISLRSIDIVDKNYPKIMSELNSFFGINWTKDLPKIFIVENRKTFDEILGKKTENWLVGHAENRIIYLLDGIKFKTEANREYTDEKYLSLLKHELTHLFVNLLNNKHIPLWLNEGTAIYLAGQNKLRKNIPTKFKNFLKFSKESIIGEENVYEESGFVIEILVNKFGKEKLISLIKKSQDDSFKTSFKEIYDFDLNYTNINKLYLS